ncbi:MAG TPA: ABC transporter permease subunit [Nitriliruptoraceae bacterium]|nr:ABC transporter permease subunit [Nitriliruptoraceae bacterium]
MGTTVFTRSLRDRGAQELLGAVAVGLMLLFGMAVYADIDVSFYYDMPPAMLDLMGISDQVGGTAGIAYGAIYGFMGALTLAGLSVSIGASSIAGEERDGTLGLLLGNPRSRGRVLASKLAALVALTTLGAVVMLAVAAVAPDVLGVDVGTVDLVAMMTHMGANALLWGMLAACIGAWSGNRTAASGVAAGAMVLSYLLASLLPLFDGGQAWAQWSPWYWFSGHQPEVNGIDGRWLAMQVGVTVVLAGNAFVGLDRRDLRERRGRTTLVDRLRAHPMTKQVADRVAGSARVSSIMARSTADHQGLLVVVAAIVFSMGMVYGPLFNLLPEGFTDVVDQFPDALMAMVGQADMATAAGWLQGETYSIVMPIAFLTVLVSVGAKAVAGEEEQRTMGLLLANPVPRRQVVLAKAGVLVLYAVVLGVIAFAGVAIGVVVGGLDVAIANVAATTALVTLLGVVFGAIALAVGAATGRTRWATMVSTGVALVSYFAWSFLPLSPTLGDWANLSPFDWYLGSDPLNNGMDWTDAGLLAALAALLVAMSIPLFDRRDLRG